MKQPGSTWLRIHLIFGWNLFDEIHLPAEQDALDDFNTGQIALLLFLVIACQLRGGFDGRLGGLEFVLFSLRFSAQRQPARQFD